MKHPGKPEEVVDPVARAEELLSAGVNSHEAAKTCLRELVARVRELERQLIEARFAPLGDNHHNAAACPYCSPKLPPAPKKEDSDGK